MDRPDQPILELLKQGKIEIQGEFVWGSNYTFLVKVEQGLSSLSAVYKPTRGERPLWDFPPASLAKRETAAYLVSEALGWRLVPPTVYRRKGPLGAGSLQLFIEHDPEVHYFNFVEEHRQRLRPTVAFDFLINNADRKGSHVMIDQEDHIWLIDHGICFHVDEKLRTVIWDFIDEPIPEQLCTDLASLSVRLESIQDDPSELAQGLMAYISQAEVRSLAKRAERLASVGRFPGPDPDRRPYPWPQL
jgi:uncharacterized repeat protein (TIGR03843 family)